MAWLASDFLLELRRAVGVASSSGISPEGLQDSDLLPLVDREIQTALIPLLLRIREEFLVLKSSVAITSATTRVRVPARTIAGRLRDVRCTVNGTDVRLTRFQPEDRARLFPTASGAGALAGYYLEGEWIVLLGSPTQQATLDIYYFARPGRLTVTAADFVAIEEIDVIDAATSQLVWTPVHSFTGLVDIVRGDSGLSTLFAGIQWSASGPTSLIVPVAPTLLAVGDFACAQNRCPVIPLPVELHGVLVSRATVAVLRQLGKYSDAKAEEETATRLEKTAIELLSPRVESQSKVVVGSFHWRRRRRTGIP